MRIMTFFSKLKKRERGFALVDSIIGVVILAVGLVGLVQLYTYGAQYRNSANMRQKAVQLAAEKVEKLKTYTTYSEMNAAAIELSKETDVTAAGNEVYHTTVAVDANPLDDGTTYKGDENVYLVTSTVEWIRKADGTFTNKYSFYTYLRADPE